MAASNLLSFNKKVYMVSYRFPNKKQQHIFAIGYAIKRKGQHMFHICLCIFIRVFGLTELRMWTFWLFTWYSIISFIEIAKYLFTNLWLTHERMPEFHHHVTSPATSLNPNTLSIQMFVSASVADGTPRKETDYGVWQITQKII